MTVPVLNCRTLTGRFRRCPDSPPCCWFSLFSPPWWVTSAVTAAVSHVGGCFIHSVGGSSLDPSRQWVRHFLWTGESSPSQDVLLFHPVLLSCPLALLVRAGTGSLCKDLPCFFPCKGFCYTCLLTTARRSVHLTLLALSCPVTVALESVFRGGGLQFGLRKAWFTASLLYQRCGLSWKVFFIWRYFLSPYPP